MPLENGFGTRVSPEILDQGYILMVALALSILATKNEGERENR